MTASTNNEIEFQLRKLVTKYSDFFAYHQWPSEHERWVELVFALITRIGKKPEYEIRDVIEKLDDLDLLDIEGLSNISKMGADIDFDSPLAKRIIASLSETRFTEEASKKPGFTEEESKRSLSVMHEAAKSLMEHHDGKIQKYLRKYGQQMLDEFAEHFSFTGMDEKDLNNAVTYWLQNVLNMPVNLKTESIDTYCATLGISYEELVKEADNLNINVALLDDMIDQHMQDTHKEEAS